MKNYSIALFGSSIRKDFDKYSDRDLLIVADLFCDIKDLKCDYEAKGFSVSFYTYKKLTFLANKESLFIEHLKREAFIFIDREDKLSALLKTTSTITSSEIRINEAKEYFKIFDFIPSTSLGFGWYCDVFYVGFRNYLINLSAYNGSYKFSFTDLLKEMYEAGQLGESEYQILRQLRVIKRNYRTKIYDELPIRDFVEKIVAFSNKVGLTKKSTIVIEQDVEIIVKQKIACKNLSYYQKLRLLEIYYYTSKVNLPNVEKLITNPQSYAFILKNDNFIFTQMHIIDDEKKRHAITVFAKAGLNSVTSAM